jgi:hypothetical protein
MAFRSPNASRRNAIASAALVFGLVAPLTYEFGRIYERLRGGKSDPTMVVSELHANFYWRAGNATWWAGLLAFVAYRIFLDRADGTPRRLPWLVNSLLALAPVMAWLTYRYP